MGWLSRLLGSSSGRRRDSSNALWLYVRCDRCGTPLAVRVNRANELTPDYQAGGYYIRKEMMDGKCFQLMYAELHFDANGNEISREIEHGKFITRDDFEASKI
jgi:hypothetical protein